ncbi:biogenesis of lysosome-related organelles complex 1 subunit 6-like [Mizuhopecten yessoensis]|uniref:Biogenesis of lysosome-related organelles complex 1 subunit 6 n=1 Tax=Mizuhopecten yessoensis TaxID=6573 RepID=A0A210PN34_MIZYE|nr:biogenesis of lysosome-related organelles complex 1 subunit 6-like [Mizuhopecten yessoensis]OWF37902.1 Biogenesis of lysosome-related organelles complex 1 subunit 6 [Mizuhopecten yessoensis]
MSGEASTTGEVIPNELEGETNIGDTVLEIENKDETSDAITEMEEKEEEEDCISIDPAIIEKLSIGTLGHYLPNLQKSKSSLNEILQNQGILIETIQQEKTKFEECKAMEDLIETMAQAKKYYAKLTNIRKDMQSLSERSFKLKKRALKLQQQKAKEEMQREQQREREQDRERMLTAKVAKKTSEVS